jgi:hypothetical protein
MLWVRISIRMRCTTLCDKICHWLATGRLFSPGPPFSTTNKTDRHDITEILMKEALNTVKRTRVMTLKLVSLWCLISNIDSYYHIWLPALWKESLPFVLFHLIIVLCVIQITASKFVLFHLAIILCVIRITASPFVLFHLAIVLCVIQSAASLFVPFHLAIVLCVILITASPFWHTIQWPNEKG